MTRYADIATEFAEGRARKELKDRAELSHGADVRPPNWYRFIVLDVIFDPQSITPEKLDHWEHGLGVVNARFAAVAPRNAIIARRVRNNVAGAEQPAMVLYPFFPPHFSLPVKAGEHVWVMFEDVDGTQNDLGYWFCRIVQPGFVEDLNYTHADRRTDPAFSPNLKETFDGNSAPVYEFRNGSVGITAEGERYTMPDTASLVGDEDEYESLMSDSDAGRVTTYEPIPRFRKRPSDLVLEGSNNARIVIGRDRTGAVASYDNDEERGPRPNTPSADAQDPAAGSIDMVVGAGQTEATGGRRSKNSRGAEELSKGPQELVEGEGDPDFDSDRSRILISQNSPIDENFGIDTFNQEFDVGNEDRSGSVVIKSDKLRLIARCDVELLVTDFTAGDSGPVSNEDTSKWATLIITRKGDIIVKPSNDGMIKLGGADADKALVCTDLPAVVAGGRVVQGPSGTPPLTTTMGGMIAGTGTPTQGLYASKVLVVAEKT